MREPKSHQPPTADLGYRSPTIAGQQLARSIDQCWDRLSTLHRKLDDRSAAWPAPPEEPSSSEGPARHAPDRSGQNRDGLDAALTAISGAAHTLLRQLEARTDGSRAASLVEDSPPTSPATGLTRWNVRSLDC
jgi:hypothetical protein